MTNTNFIRILDKIVNKIRTSESTSEIEAYIDGIKDSISDTIDIDDYKPITRSGQLTIGDTKPDITWTCNPTDARIVYNSLPEYNNGFGGLVVNSTGSNISTSDTVIATVNTENKVTPKKP